MKKEVILFIIAILAVIAIHAQTGNTGIGTSAAGSKLTVNGSFGAAYTAITATTYTAGENDFYVIWNGTAAGTITLPASTSGPNRTGRLYLFKNTSDTYTLTIDADGSELIDNSQTVVLQPGESAVLVKTNINTASGITYEVVQISKTQPSFYLAAIGGGSQNVADGSFATLDFTAIEKSTDGGASFNLTSNTWTCPKTGIYRIIGENQGNGTGGPSHCVLSITKNGSSFPASQYFYIPNNLANSGSVTAILNLVTGDLITLRADMCSGCGSTMTSSRRRLEITRL